MNRAIALTGISRSSFNELFACIYHEFETKKVSYHRMLTSFKNSVGRCNFRSTCNLVDAFNHITRHCTHNSRSASHADYTEYSRKKNQMHQIHDTFSHTRKKIILHEGPHRQRFPQIKQFVALEAANGSHQAGIYWKPSMCS